MRLVAVVRDLWTATRIEDTVTHAGATMRRVDDPTALPPAEDVDLVVVDWADRATDWGAALISWRGRAPGASRPRIILFGPHTDLDAHAAARAADLGPMKARSALFADLPRLVAEAGS